MYEVYGRVTGSDWEWIDTVWDEELAIKMAKEMLYYGRYDEVMIYDTVDDRVWYGKYVVEKISGDRFRERLEDGRWHKRWYFE